MKNCYGNKEGDKAYMYNYDKLISDSVHIYSVITIVIEHVVMHISLKTIMISDSVHIYSVITIVIEHVVMHISLKTIMISYSVHIQK